MRYYRKSPYPDGLSESAIGRIAYWVDVAPSPLSTVDVWQLGVQFSDRRRGQRVPRAERSLSAGVEANWERPEDDGANDEWIRDCLDDVRQYSDGSVYLDFPGFLEGSAVYVSERLSER